MAGLDERCSRCHGDGVPSCQCDAALVMHCDPPPGVTIDDMCQALRELQATPETVVFYCGAEPWTEAAAPVQIAYSVRPEQRIAQLESALRSVLGTIDPREHRSAAQQLVLAEARRVLAGGGA